MGLNENKSSNFIPTKTSLQTKIYNKKQYLTKKSEYRLDHLILERYPTFLDALRDLDDCLTLIHLYSYLPADNTTKVTRETINKCNRLEIEFKSYIIFTHSFRNAFISVKGIYYQAIIEGQIITWMVPHQYMQLISIDVDFSTMSIFLEFYLAMLKFVNSRLYHSLGVKYPIAENSNMDSVEIYLKYITTNLSHKSLYTNLKPTKLIDSQTTTKINQHFDKKLLDPHDALNSTTKPKYETTYKIDNEKQKKKIAVLDVVDESIICGSLFKGLYFYLSREVPRELLSFVILAFGGKVGHDGPESPYTIEDTNITHHISDGSTQSYYNPPRCYIQPQWVFDSANFKILVPTSPYFPNQRLPPHLSPFVSKEYLPSYVSNTTEIKTSNLSFLEKMIIGIKQSKDDDGKKLTKNKNFIHIQNDFQKEQEKDTTSLSYKSYLSKTPNITSHRALVNISEYTIDNLKKTALSRKTRRLYEAIKLSMLSKEVSKNAQTTSTNECKS